MIRRLGDFDMAVTIGYPVTGKGRDIVHRWRGNPVLAITDLDFRCSDIHNAGIVSFGGSTLGLITIEHLSGIRAIHLAYPESDGRYRIDREPFISPSSNQEYVKHEIMGVLDARITYLDEWYYIIFCAFGVHGYRLALARTKDFKSVERMGFISEPDTKAGVLFPAKIKQRYARLERPNDNCIWVSYSDDLKYWGASEKIASPRSGYWDANRIGPGPCPIETEEGWLVIYYGAKDTSAGPIYRLGAMLLDKDEPTNVLGRTGIPLLSPREDYERIGDLPNIIFSTGARVDPDGNIRIAYGAANSCICLGVAKMDEVIELCKAGEAEY